MELIEEKTEKKLVTPKGSEPTMGKDREKEETWNPSGTVKESREG